MSYLSAPFFNIMNIMSYKILYMLGILLPFKEYILIEIFSMSFIILRRSLDEFN